MSKTTSKSASHSSSASTADSSDRNACGPCCRIESIVSTDDRGQMVLPRDVREKAGIKPGDKLALVSFENNGKITCIALVPADSLSGTVQDLLGPLLGVAPVG